MKTPNFINRILERLHRKGTAWERTSTVDSSNNEVKGSETMLTISASWAIMNETFSYYFKQQCKNSKSFCSEVNSKLEDNSNNVMDYFQDTHTHSPNAVSNKHFSSQCPVASCFSWRKQGAPIENFITQRNYAPFRNQFTKHMTPDNRREDIKKRKEWRDRKREQAGERIGGTNRSAKSQSQTPTTHKLEAAQHLSQKS